MLDAKAGDIIACTNGDRCVVVGVRDDSERYDVRFPPGVTSDGDNGTRTYRFDGKHINGVLPDLARVVDDDEIEDALVDAVAAVGGDVDSIPIEAVQLLKLGLLTARRQRKKTRRWYDSVNEFVAFTSTLPLFVMVKRAGVAASATPVLAPNGRYRISVCGLEDVDQSTFSDYTYSIDGGKTWLPFGVEQ